MAKKIKKKKSEKCNWKGNCTTGDMVYGLGFVGAVIYNITRATGFWSGILGVLKAIIWPVFVVYQLMKFLGM
ncbi:MAG: hypothetical protein ISS01_01960 [Nanoarchaeota archaeon]|nr:hypothetical protein [Nanoarchaeota archaeon]